ncbi:hypothetical protein WN943_006295 [Citrus x changshan-huyou]
MERPNLILMAQQLSINHQMFQMQHQQQGTFIHFTLMLYYFGLVDDNWALVDALDMVRSQMNFKRLSLTDIKIDINRVPRKKSLIEAMEKADVKNK